MAVYTITTQTNSFDVTKDGETREYPFNELIVQVNDTDVYTLELYNKRSQQIDYALYTDTDTIDVNGTTSFIDAEALKTFVEDAIFSTPSGGGGISPDDYATATVGGTIKVRLDGNDLYMTNNGDDA